jgi:hypothetical protein
VLANVFVTPRLSECLGRAMRCRDLNDRNGLMVAARTGRVLGKV